MLLRLLCFALMMFGTPAAWAEERRVPQSNEQVMLSYAPVVKKAAPAVVNIYTKRTEKLNIISPLMQDPLLKFFLENNPALGKLQQEREVRSLGSGVIVNPKGLIVTNYHVIKGSEAIRVVLADRREFDARLLVKDDKTDLALLKIGNGEENFPALLLRDSDDLQVGDLVLAIGNPFGIGQTVTSGIVSALARTAVGVTDYQFFIQTDAAINPGNSGGALVTMDGRLVGVNTAIYSRTGGSLGIGFATPSNIVRAVVQNVDSKGKVVRPWFGAEVQAITSDIAQSLGLPRPVGVIVAEVTDKSPAARAGLKVGDVILELDGHEIQDPQALKYRIAIYSPGTQVMMVVLRGDKRETLKLDMEKPSYTPAPDVRLLKGSHPFSGARVANLSPALAMDLSLAEEKGVIIIEIEGRSPALRVGLRPGDMVESVNGVAVESAKQLEGLIGRFQKNWEVAFRREGKLLTLRVQ